VLCKNNHKHYLVKLNYFSYFFLGRGSVKSLKCVIVHITFISIKYEVSRDFEINLS
jgi:hypothetical protein